MLPQSFQKLRNRAYDPRNLRRSPFLRKDYDVECASWPNGVEKKGESLSENTSYQTAIPA